MDNSSNDFTDFTLIEDINGPALAAVVGVIMVLAVTANLYIIAFSVCHCMTLKEPSMIFLSSLALVNLLCSVTCMPFTVVTAASGEWIIGATLEQKEITCWIVGFLFSSSLSLSVHLIGLISFDRFLLIVKPFFYKRIKKPWLAYLAVGITSLYSIILATPPFYGLGSFSFSRSMASCLPVWENRKEYPIYTLAAAIPVFTIILITTVWTFLITRNIIRGEHNRRMFAVAHTEMEEQERNIYSYRVRKLIGLFGTILIVNFISFLPFAIIFFVGLVIGFETIPSPVYATAFVFLLLYNIMLPIVQSFFRPDIRRHTTRMAKQLSCMYHSRMGVADACTNQPIPQKTLDQHLDASCETLESNISVSTFVP